MPLDRMVHSRIIFAGMKFPAAACIIITVFLACSDPESKPAESGREISLVQSRHEAGKKLFYVKCAGCHMVNKELTGPALRDVRSRWPDSSLLYAFIRNSDSVIARLPYARSLWLKYNQTAMTPHPDLTDAQIYQILAYIESVSVPAGQ